MGGVCLKTGSIAEVCCYAVAKLYEKISFTTFCPCGQRNETPVMLGRRPMLRSVLATKTRQAPTENNIKRKNISELEGIAPKGCRTTSVKYPQ